MKCWLHYTIKQFYRQIISVGVRHTIHQKFFYWQHHRRNPSVGILIVGNSHFCCYFCRKKKNTDGLTDEQRVPKVFFFTLELYWWNYFVCISNIKSPTTIPSVIVAWAINILELSVKYRQIQSVGSVNGNSPTMLFHRWMWHEQ